MICPFTVTKTCCKNMKNICTHVKIDYSIYVKPSHVVNTNLFTVAINIMQHDDKNY